MPRLQRRTLVLVLLASLVGVAAMSGSVGAATADEFGGDVPNVETYQTNDSDVDDENSTDDSPDDDPNADDGNSTDDNSTDDDTGADDEPEPAAFEITNVETNSPTTVGETVRVTINVTNTGGEADSKDVAFSLGQYLKDEDDVALNPGESTTVELSYVTKSGDAQEWPLTVMVDDSTRHQGTVIVEEPSRDSDQNDRSSRSSGGGSSTTYGDPAFEIDTFEIDEPVKAGEEIRMNATIRNTGTADGERLLWFTSEDRTVNETVIQLDRDETMNVTYALETPTDGHGVWNLSARTPDDQVDRSVEVAELHSNITIDSVETNGPVTAGEMLNATVNVSNTGDITGNQTVMLYLDNQSMDARAISLGPNESTTVTLTYRSNAWTTGELNLSVATDDDRQAFVGVVEEKPTEPTDTASESSGSTADASEPDATTDSSTSDSDIAGETDDSTPGFGIVPALIALVAAIGVARLRRNSPE